MNTAVSSPLSVNKFRSPEKLRRSLEQYEYLPEKLSRTIAISSPSETLDIEAAMRRTAGDSEYNTLVRLFLLARSVDEAAVDRALGTESLPELLDCGLLFRDGAGVRSLAKIVPYAGMYCASDFNQAERGGGTLLAEHVLNVGPASVTLANLSVRKPGGSLFDLGTGSGVQSLLASPTSSRVVGTDTNRRALNFAEFNARLNGMQNIEWREGSFFEPVEGETFDSVVANPPFVVSPSSRFIFRDAGLGGDRVSEYVVRGCAAKLNDGGYASILINWHHDGEMSRRPFEWARDSGCDLWLIISSDTDVLTYASKWLRQSEGRDPAHYAKQLDEWMAYYAEAGISRIAAGEVVLRKRSGGKNWQRADVLEIYGASGDCGGHIAQVFQNEDFLSENPTDEALLAARLRVAEDVAVRQDLAWSPGGWELRGISLSMPSGLPFSGDGDAAIMRMLGWLDGSRPLGELIRQLAETVQVEESRIVGPTLEVVRNLVRATFLRVAN